MQRSWLGNLNERDHMEDKDVCGRITWTWILKIGRRHGLDLSGWVG
jgi:hypothetical protein